MTNLSSCDHPEVEHQAPKEYASANEIRDALAALVKECGALTKLRSADCAYINDLAADCESHVARINSLTVRVNELFDERNALAAEKIAHLQLIGDLDAQVEKAKAVNDHAVAMWKTAEAQLARVEAQNQRLRVDSKLNALNEARDRIAHLERKLSDATELIERMTGGAVRRAPEDSEIAGDRE